MPVIVVVGPYCRRQRSMGSYPSECLRRGVPNDTGVTGLSYCNKKNTHPLESTLCQRECQWLSKSRCASILLFGIMHGWIYSWLYSHFNQKILCRCRPSWGMGRAANMIPPSTPVLSQSFQLYPVSLTSASRWRRHVFTGRPLFFSSSGSMLRLIV